MAETGSDNKGVIKRSAVSVPALENVLEVERLRIDRDNRRTDLLEKTLELADAQDQRQYEFASRTRDDEVALEQQRLRFLQSLVWTLVAVSSGAVVSLLGLFIFGNEAQRTAIADVASPLLIGLAGWGVISTLTRAVKALTNR